MKAEVSISRGAPSVEDFSADKLGPAVTPDEAAESLVTWAEKLDISKTGQYWAPRGPGAF